MLGALIGAGASLLGGVLSNNSAKKAANKQAQLQKQFAQNAIQWKAADAEKAGISKLYALGANTTSYSPVSTGGTDYGLASAGQDIGRAIDATQSAGGRASRLATELASAQIEGVRIDNEIKRTDLASKIATRTQPGMPPAYPGSDTVPHMDGQGDSTVVKYEDKIQPSQPGQPHKSFGVRPEVDLYRTADGGYTPQVPQELAESMEASSVIPIEYLRWMYRNNVLPSISSAHQTIPHPAPPGQYWMYNPISSRYTLVDKSRFGGIRSKGTY